MIHRCTDTAGVTGTALSRARSAGAGHPPRGAASAAPTFAPGAACAAPEHPTAPPRQAPVPISAHNARLLAHREAWIPEPGHPQDPEAEPFVVELPRQIRAAHEAQTLITTMCWPLEDMLDVQDVALTVREVVREAALGGGSVPAGTVATAYASAGPGGAPAISVPRHDCDGSDTSSTLTLAILVSERELRIEVGDLDPRPAFGPQPTTASETGAAGATAAVSAASPASRAESAAARGARRTLGLVDALSDEHGVRSFTGGKITWMCWKLPCV